MHFWVVSDKTCCCGNLKEGKIKHLINRYFFFFFVADFSVTKINLTTGISEAGENQGSKINLDPVIFFFSLFWIAHSFAACYCSMAWIKMGLSLLSTARTWLSQWKQMFCCLFNPVLLRTASSHRIAAAGVGTPILPHSPQQRVKCKAIWDYFKCYYF